MTDFKDIKSGDFAFFSGRKLFSHIIQERTNEFYSHIGIFLWVTIGSITDLYVLEALKHPGIKMRKLSNYLIELQRDNEIIDWYILDDQKVSRVGVIQDSLALMDKKYPSYWRLFLNFTKIGRLIKPYFRSNPDRFFCSQMGARILFNNGYHHYESVAQDEVSPGYLSRFTCLRIGDRLIAPLSDTKASSVPIPAGDKS